MTPHDVLEGRARWSLTLGSCLDVEHGLPSLRDKTVDHVITDPPYDKRVHARGGHVRRFDGGPQIAEIPFDALVDVSPVAREISRLVARWSIVFCAVRQIHDWATALEASGVNVLRVMAWVKPNASPQFSGDRPGHAGEARLLV